jgi:hypothetical protein
MDWVLKTLGYFSVECMDRGLVMTKLEDFLQNFGQ